MSVPNLKEQGLTLLETRDELRKAYANHPELYDLVVEHKCLHPALKTVADETKLEHQVCKSHVGRNTQNLIDELCPNAAAAMRMDLCMPAESLQSKRKPIFCD